MSYVHSGKIDLETYTDRKQSAEMDYQKFINEGGTLE
jgi:hypothetical protein